MATKQKAIPRLKGASHRIESALLKEAVIGYDENQTPRSLQLKGLDHSLV